MGRPSLLSDKDKKRRLIESFEDSMEKALPQSTACALAGISEGTFYLWMQYGKEGREPYAEFFEAVTYAKARGEAGLIEMVQKATHAENEGIGVKAATWLLERRFPDKYGASVTLRKAKDEALEVLLGTLRKRLDPETFARVISVLAEDESPEHSEGAGSVH